MTTFITSYAEFWIPLLITIGFGVWSMSSPKLAKTSFVLSALIALAWIIFWIFSGTDLETNYRIIIGIILSVIIIISIIAIWIKITKSQYISSELIEKRKAQELATSLKGLIIKVENILEEYDIQQEVAITENMRFNPYPIYRNKALEWQQELESFIKSNFPKYYLDTLNFDQNYTPGSIRNKIKVLKNEIKKLESE